MASLPSPPALTGTPSQQSPAKSSSCPPGRPAAKTPRPPNSAGRAPPVAIDVPMLPPLPPRTPSAPYNQTQSSTGTIEFASHSKAEGEAAQAVLNMKEATGQLWGYLESAIAMEDQVHKQRLQHVQIIQNYCANVTSSFNAQLDAFYAQSTQATQILTRQHEVDAAAIEALKAQVQVVATEQKRLVEVVKTDAREMKALQEKLEAAERERDELSGAVERDIAARTERRREEEMIEKKLLGIVGAKARVIGGAKEGSPAIAVTSEAASSSSASTKPTKRSASPGTSTTDAPVAKKARPDSPADPLNIL